MTDTSLERFTIPRAHFLALSSSGGDSESVKFLWRGQSSRRKLLFRLLFEAVEKDPTLLGDLPPATAVRDVLEAAQAASPTAVDDLLLHPQVGGWAAYTLRRLRGGAGESGTAPEWVEFGGMHVLGIVAAMRAGVSWRTRIPHRDGKVMLFGLGMALFPGLSADALVDAETSGGRLTLTAEGVRVNVLAHGDSPDAERWWGLHTMTANGSPQFSVALDDLDPFRDLADPVPPQRLSDAEVAAWRVLFADGWDLLCRHHADSAAAIASGVVSLVPLPLGDGRETRSASSGEAFGSVMLSQPPDAVTLAVSLVHEFQHIKLGGLMHLLAELTQEQGDFYYAPWRDDPRPIAGLLQGVYAFFGIAAFWRRRRAVVTDVEARLADFEYAYARTQTCEALRIIKACDALTELGHEFVNGLVEQTESWDGDKLDPEAEDAARVVTDHHRAGWRVRHQHPSVHEVDMLFDEWRGRGNARLTGVQPRVAPAEASRWSHGMVGLVRRRIVSPETWRDFEGFPEFSWLGSATSPADIALVSGDKEAARPLYMDLLRRDSEDFDAWAGLTLALDEGAATPSLRALQRRPELVKALYTRLKDAGLVRNPLTIAHWIGAGLA
jgi:HEXXH motif-containing protein